MSYSAVGKEVGLFISPVIFQFSSLHGAAVPLTDSANRALTALGSTTSMRRELENALTSRQHRRETPDFGFRHRPNVGAPVAVQVTDAHDIKAPNVAV